MISQKHFDALQYAIDPGIVCNKDRDAFDQLPALIRAMQERIVELETGMKLDKPAKVGAVSFGKGIDWKTVIGAAQRHYEYANSPEYEWFRSDAPAEMREAFKKVFGTPPQPAAPVVEGQPDPASIGWAYAYACNLADGGVDIRQTECPAMLEAAQKDFSEAAAAGSKL